MSNQIVLKSFADLAPVLRLEETPNQTATPATFAEWQPTEPPDLNRILADLAAANTTLTEAGRKDQEARAVAMETLAQYDALVAARHEAEVKERLRTLKLEAARERLQEALSPLEEGARPLTSLPLPAPTSRTGPALRVARLYHGSVLDGPGRRSVCQVLGLR